MKRMIVSLAAHLAAPLALAAMLAPGAAFAQDGAAPAALPLIERHAGPAPAIILQGVTVRAGAEMLYLSGQLAAPLDPEAIKAKTPEQITTADYGNTEAQTVSVLNKIKALLAEHGYAMSDVIKMSAFVAADPAMGGKMDFAGFNAGFRQFFGTADNAETVARSTFQVAALVAPQYLIELEVVAAK